MQVLSEADMLQGPKLVLLARGAALCANATSADANRCSTRLGQPRAFAPVLIQTARSGHDGGRSGLQFFGFPRTKFHSFDVRARPPRFPQV
jgi:hypothetical protein